jgi:hypothetical protein
MVSGSATDRQVLPRLVQRLFTTRAKGCRVVAAFVRLFVVSSINFTGTSASRCMVAAMQ